MWGKLAPSPLVCHCSVYIGSSLYHGKRRLQDFPAVSRSTHGLEANIDSKRFRVYGDEESYCWFDTCRNLNLFSC